MPGVPGTGGPVPKPSSQRRRRNKPEVAVDTAPAGARAEAPAADPEWHAIAREWFESLALSGQSQFYEASDWAMARLNAEMISRLCGQSAPSAVLFSSILAASTSLLSTEGDRRRLRLELARTPQVDPDEVAADATVTDLRSRLGG